MIDDEAIEVMVSNALTPVGPVLSAYLYVVAAAAVLILCAGVACVVYALVALRRAHAEGDQQAASGLRLRLVASALLVVAAPAVLVVAHAALR